MLRIILVYFLWSSCVVMAMSSSRMFSVEVVYQILDDHEMLDNEIHSIMSSVNIDSESNDETDYPQGDFLDEDEPALLPSLLLKPDIADMYFDSMKKNGVFPAERDSLLHAEDSDESTDEDSDSDTSTTGKKVVMHPCQ